MPLYTNFGTGFTFNRPSVSVRQYFITPGASLIFAWRPRINDPGVTFGRWDPTTNIITWQWRIKGISRAAIRESGTSTDSITPADRRKALGHWTHDLSNTGIFPWPIKLRNIFLYDGGVSSDIINGAVPLSVQIEDGFTSGDIITLDSPILGAVLDLGTSHDTIRGNPTGITESGTSTDTIRPGGYQMGRLIDQGESQDVIRGIFKINVEDYGLSSDRIAVRVGRAIACDAGDGSVKLEETNYVF